MKTAWCSFLLLAMAAGTASGYDNIRIEASLQESVRTVSGRTTVTFRAPDSLMKEVYFRLWGAYLCQQNGLDTSSGACGMRIDSAMVNGRPAEVRAGNSVAHAVVPLPESPLPDSLQVTVYFTTIIPFGFDRLGVVGGTYFLDGWFPMPAPWRNGQWAPVMFTPETELVGDFYNFEVLFSAPDSLQQIAPGLVSADTAEGTITAHYLLAPVHDFAIALGRGFALRDYKEGSTKVSIYHKADAERVDSLAASVLFTIRYMEEHVGPYRYDQLLILVGVPFSGGVEFPAMYWQGEPDGGKFSRFGRLVAIHETIHQWFYGMLASSQAESPWMDESVTSYFTAKIADAESDGPSALDGFGFTAKASVIDRLQGHEVLDLYPITHTATAYDKHSYFATIYGKGMMVMHTFASLLGREESRFWREFYDRFALSVPTEDDFISLANEFPPYSERQNAAEVLAFNQRLDYQVTRITFERIADTALIRSEVAYSLLNSLSFPVPMQVTFASGAILDTTVAPLAGNHTLSITDSFPVIAAIIDPAGWYAVDHNYLNNSLQVSASGAGLRVFSGLTFLVESLFSLLWGI